MGAHDKISNKIDDVAGKAKEGLGKATGDDKTRTEGKLDQAKSSVKDAAEHVKPAPLKGVTVAGGHVRVTLMPASWNVIHLSAN